MTKITGVHHVAVFPTADKYKETVEFYTKLLGFPVKQSWGSEETPCLMVSCGDNSCMEIIPSETEHGKDGPLVHIAFWCGDGLDEIVEDVRAAGYAVKHEPQDLELCGQAIRNAFFYGPLGEEIELFWVK